MDLICLNVIRPQGAAGRIGSGVDAGEGAEFVGEVRLVVVSTVERHLRPGDVHSSVQLLHGALKAQNAGPGFGREADLFPKNLRKVALAPTSAPGYFPNRGNAGRALKTAQREVHDGVPGESAGEPMQQKLLQIAKPVCGSGELAQAIAKRAGRLAPGVFQANVPIAEEVNGVRDEGSEAAGVEDDADQVSHIGGVDDLIGRAGSNDEGRLSGLRGFAFAQIEQKVAGQVENYLHTAGGQNALPAVRRIENPRVPEAANASVERGGGNVFEVDHLRPRGGYSTKKCERKGVLPAMRCAGKVWSILGGMRVPAKDAELVQIVDAALTDAARRAGDWLACRVGCTQCCYGAFQINALDAARLQSGMETLRATEPTLAQALELRARAWLAIYGADFPGDLTTGRLGETEAELELFEHFANEAACPALDEATGRCDVYAWRPMTCRVFGPPIRMDAGTGSQALGHCELCFHGASEDEVAACEMPVPQELEAKVLDEVGEIGETVVAFALLRNLNDFPALD